MSSSISRRRLLELLALSPWVPWIAACGSGSSGRTGASSGPSPSPAEGSPTAAALGTAVGIPNSFYGLNSGDNLADFDSSSSFMATFGQLAPAVLRYPGGNSANWFDLSTGLLLTDPNPPVPAGQLTSFTQPPAWTFSALADYLNAASAQPTIVVNLLTGNMSSQIAALQSAAATVPISRIELGNELYLEGVDGDQYAQVFPSAQSYATAANAWADALTGAFPQVQLGVPMSLTGGDTRTSGWNAALAPLLSAKISALILHNYQDPPNPPFTGSSVAADQNALAAAGGPAAIFSLVAHGIQSMQAVAASYPGYKIWNTETNLRDDVGGIANTWTHGLYIAYQLLAVLEVPGIALALAHAVTNGVEYSAIWSTSGSFPNSSIQYAANTLSATGLTMQLVFRAAHQQTTAQPLSFSANPTQTGANGGAAPSLYGWSFGQASSAVVLNLSAGQYALSFAESSLFSGAVYTQLSGNPSAYVGNPENLTAAQGTFSTAAGLTLPPYSITLLEV